MRITLRSIMAAGAALIIGLTPMAAYADRSLGMYQTTDRKMDYQGNPPGLADTRLIDALRAAYLEKKRSPAK